MATRVSLCARRTDVIWRVFVLFVTGVDWFPIGGSGTASVPAGAAPTATVLAANLLRSIYPDDHHDARGRMAGAGCTRPRRCAGRAGLHSLSWRDFVEERDV